MRVCILGAAAGGGFPQWNCGCPLCAGVRAGEPGLRPRTQTSVAFSADGERWFLLCASPDIRAQIESHRPLWPSAPRSSPIEGVLLPNADIDATAGLLSLRERQPLVLFATGRVLGSVLERNALMATLRRYPSQLATHALRLGGEVELHDRGGECTGLVAAPFAAVGRPPPHLTGRGYDREDNVGFAIRDLASGGTLVFIPCAGRIDDSLVSAVDAATVLLFDGTFWSEEELGQVVPGAPPAHAMAHVPVGGPSGSLAVLAPVRAKRRLFVHVNNTNPMLREDGPEHAMVRAAGWEVARDGMELVA